jgi:hypothetical protein
MTQHDNANIIREMIRHEDNLLVNRTNWMITLQGLLLAALAFSWDRHMAVTFLIGGLGILYSLFFIRYLNLTDKAIFKLLKWWDDNGADYDGPSVIGLRDEEIIGPPPWKLLPWTFIISWVFLLFTRIRNF